MALMTRRISLLAMISALVLIAPVTGVAAKPGGKPGNVASSVTIAAAPNPILYGHSVTISGKLTAKTVAGVFVTLEAAPYPYSSFVPVAMAPTDSQGGYVFAQSPKLNTEYRVMAKSKPHAASTTLLVQVRTRVSLHLSTTTPAVGTRVKFSGSVTPAHDGQMVLIQRRRLNGTFVTVASTTLLHTTTGASSYNKKVRINASGTYRVIKPHDADHATGLSGTRKITVH
jgi:hypothetical protein